MSSMTNRKPGPTRPRTPRPQPQPAERAWNKQQPAGRAISGFAVVPLRLFLGITPAHWPQLT